MKLGKSDCFAAPRIDEVIFRRARCEGRARPFAGGQSLPPQFAMPLASPAVVVDINNLNPSAHLGDGENSVRIVALVRPGGVGNLAALSKRRAAIYEAADPIRHAAICNRGIVVRALARPDPSGGWPGLGLASDIEWSVRRPAGPRNRSSRRPPRRAPSHTAAISRPDRERPAPRRVPLPARPDRTHRYLPQSGQQESSTIHVNRHRRRHPAKVCRERVAINA